MATRKPPPWNKANPVKPSARIQLTPAQKKEARDAPMPPDGAIRIWWTTWLLRRKAKATKSKTKSDA